MYTNCKETLPKISIPLCFSWMYHVCLLLFIMSLYPHCSCIEIRSFNPDKKTSAVK